MTKHLQKIVRSLHRNIFHSVPNTGPREIDLSELKPVITCEPQEYSIEFDVYRNLRANKKPEASPAILFAQQNRIASSAFTPEPWDIGNQDHE
jgi:hypothetical protein